jgi:GWxTD domain-containing protein
MAVRVRVFPVLVYSLFLVSLIAINLQAQPATGASSAAQSDDPLQRPRPRQRGNAKAEKAYKRWLDEDVSDIILPEERDAFRKLTNDAERDSFIETFWDHRNPHPESTVNEYKEEHYRRIAFANERFSAGVPGSRTDRGRIYIIHGPPDSIESHPSGGPYVRSAEEGGGQTITSPFEIWHYRNLDGIGQNVDVEFVDTCGCGEYHMTIDRGEKDISNIVPGMGPTLLESLGITKQADRRRGGVETLAQSPFGNNSSKEFERIELQAKVFAPPAIQGRSIRSSVTSTMRSNLLPFDVRVDFVKGDSNTVMTPVTIQVANRDLTYVVKDGVQRAALNLSGSVTTVTGRVAATFEEPLHLDVPADLLEKFASNVSLFQEPLKLRPGLYRLDLMLKDMNGVKVGIFAHSIQVPNFNEEDRLSTSTLILADLVDPVPPREIGSGSFVLGTDRVRPRVAPANGEPATFASGQRINLWMQVYNLAVDNMTLKPSATVEYKVTNVATGQSVFELAQKTEQMGNVGKQLTLRQRLPAERLEPGTYLLSVRVVDAIGKQEIAPEAKFSIR